MDDSSRLAIPDEVRLRADLDAFWAAHRFPAPEVEESEPWPFKEPWPAPLPEGVAAFCKVTDHPMPTRDDMYAARTSPSERRRVDLMYAAACGFEGDEVQVFLDRCALYDIREAARQEADAIERLRDERNRRVKVETQGELVRLRGNGLRRVRPRKP